MSRPHRIHRRTPRTVWLYALAVLLAVSCSSGSGPRGIELGDDTTFDGLRVVKDTRLHRVWIRPGLDLSTYDKIRYEDAGVQYSPTRGQAGSNLKSGYAMSDRGKALFESTVRKTFVEELKRSTLFALTDENGPDVLIVRAGLLDVVYDVPPDDSMNNDLTFVSVLGKATVFVEVRDSQSNTTLARMVDRRVIDAPGQSIRVSSPAADSEDVRRVARYWASSLRRGLDELHQHTPADD